MKLEDKLSKFGQVLIFTVDHHQNAEENGESSCPESLDEADQREYDDEQDESDWQERKDNYGLHGL